MNIDIFNAWEVAGAWIGGFASGGVLVAVGTAWVRQGALALRADAARDLAAAEEIRALNERARWAPAYSGNLNAITADPHVTGELVAITSHPQAAAGLADLAEEVALVQALSDRPAEDEDEVGDEQPGEATSRLLLPVLAVARWWGYLLAWCDEAIARVRARMAERHQIGFGEQATDVDPFAELIAATPRHLRNEDATDTGYVGRRWWAGTEHTGVHPIVVPAQREAAE